MSVACPILDDITAPMTVRSYAVEIWDTSGSPHRWISNGLRFATMTEARCYANADYFTSMHWNQVMPSEDPARDTYDGSRLGKICEGCGND